MNPAEADRSLAFEAHRSHLMGVAYRMVGSASEAEDMVQEAFLRWQAAEGDIRSPRAFLTTIVTRLCLDHLKSAAVRRTDDIGPWLPEPTSADWVSDRRAHDSMSYAFLALLETLFPVERAVRRRRASGSAGASGRAQSCRASERPHASFCWLSAGGSAIGSSLLRRMTSSICGETRLLRCSVHPNARRRPPG